MKLILYRLYLHLLSLFSTTFITIQSGLLFMITPEPDFLSLQIFSHFPCGPLTFSLLWFKRFQFSRLIIINWLIIVMYAHTRTYSFKKSLTHFYFNVANYKIFHVEENCLWLCNSIFILLDFWVCPFVLFVSFFQI